MKRLVILSFIIVTASWNLLQAQRFEGSLIAGLNFAQIDGDDLAGYNKFGLTGGGRVAAVLNPKWRVSMDLLFSQRGSRRSTTEFAYAYDKIHLNHVEIPVMAHLSDWKIQFGAGFSYSRLFNHEIIDGIGEDVSDSFIFNTNHFAFVGEAAYYSNDHIGYGLRWSHGFTNLDTDKDNKGLIEKWVTFRIIYRFNVSELAE